MRTNVINNFSFKSGYVTTCKSALSAKIKEDVVDSFNTKNKTKPDKLSDSVNYFVLAGGNGTRMLPYINAVTPILGTQNKITLPFPIDQQSALRVIDFPMYMGKTFLAKDGYSITESDTPNGNFSDVIKFYRNNPKEVKDTLICCGDNIYPLSSDKLKNIIANAQENGTDVILFASKQKPEAAANRFGVLRFHPSNPSDNNLLSLDKLDDLTNLETFHEQADKYLTDDGYCVSYPGMFYMKKEVMNWLLDKIEENPRIIQKIHPLSLKSCPDEQYDFIAALKLIKEKLPESKMLILPIGGWQDVGNADAYLRFLSSIRANSLQNFPQDEKTKILNALAAKVQPRKKKLILSSNNSGNYKLVTQYPVAGEKTDIYSDKQISFGSKIVKIDSPSGISLTQKQLAFLDKFEEMSEVEKDKYKIASGLTANIYYIKHCNFVIKSIKDIENKELQKRFDISLENEGHNLKILAKNGTRNVQRYIALAQTEKGRTFLLTQYFDGKKLSKSSQLSHPVIDKLLDTLFRLDRNRIVNFDWNPNNILIDGNKLSLIDFQWAKKLTDFNSEAFNVVSPTFENASNMTAFETSTLSMLILKTKNYGLLEKYLKIKAKYCQKEAQLIAEMNSNNIASVRDKIEFSILRSNVYKECSPSVLNAEMLRLDFLYNNLKRNFFLAPAIDKPKNKNMAVFYKAKAQKAAHNLANIKIPKHISHTEKRYLHKMKEMGKYYLRYLDLAN